MHNLEITFPVDCIPVKDLITPRNLKLKWWLSLRLTICVKNSVKVQIGRTFTR